MPTLRTRISLVLCFLTLAACIKRPATIGSDPDIGENVDAGADTEAYARKHGFKYRVLLPLILKEDDKSFCFYDVQWEKKAGKFSHQAVVSVTKSAVTLNDLTTGPNAAAGLATVSGSLATGIYATGLCLGLTAGLGSPVCLVAGGGSAALLAVGVVGAATINYKKWARAFDGGVPKITSDAQINELIKTLTRIGNGAGKKNCRPWKNPETTEAERTAIWKNILNHVK